MQEIIRYEEPRSVASNDYSVKGVISLRGQIVPVHDLASRLSVISEIGEQTKIVIVEVGEQTVGLIVDAVDEVLTIQADQLEQIPGADTTLMDSIARIDERPVQLLRTPARSSPATTSVPRRRTATLIDVDGAPGRRRHDRARAANRQPRPRDRRPRRLQPLCVHGPRCRRRRTCRPGANVSSARLTAASRRDFGAQEQAVSAQRRMATCAWHPH